MEKKMIFNWTPQTYNLWRTHEGDRREFVGTMFECMEEAHSQCDGVSFTMEFHEGILKQLVVFIKGHASGLITQE